MTPMPDPVPFPRSSPHYAGGRGPSPRDVDMHRRGPDDEGGDEEDEGDGADGTDGTFVRREKVIATPIPEGDPTVDVDALVKEIDAALAKKKTFFNKKNEAKIRELLNQSRGVLAGAEAVVNETEQKYQEALQRAARAEAQITGSYALAKTANNAIEQANDVSARSAGQLGRVSESYQARDEAISNFNKLRSQIVGVARILGCPLEKCDEERAILWLVENANLFALNRPQEGIPSGARAGELHEKIARAGVLAEVEREAARLGGDAGAALGAIAGRMRGDTIAVASTYAPIPGSERVKLQTEERDACAKIVRAKIDEIRDKADSDIAFGRLSEVLTAIEDRHFQGEVKPAKPA